MKINQQQLKEDLENRLPPKEDLPFEIVSAEEKPNAKSSDGVMTKLKLRVHAEGRKYVVKSVLGLWQNGGAATIKSFYDAVGADADDELLTEDMIGMRGIVHIKHAEFNGRPQAEVAWWVPAIPGQKVEIPEAESTRVVEDDDIPF